MLTWYGQDGIFHILLKLQISVLWLTRYHPEGDTHKASHLCEWWSDLHQMSHMKTWNMLWFSTTQTCTCHILDATRHHTWLNMVHSTRYFMLKAKKWRSWTWQAHLTMLDEVVTYNKFPTFPLWHHQGSTSTCHQRFPTMIAREWCVGQHWQCWHRCCHTCHIWNTELSREIKRRIVWLLDLWPTLVRNTWQGKSSVSLSSSAKTLVSQKFATFNFHILISKMLYIFFPIFCGILTTPSAPHSWVFCNHH